MNITVSKTITKKSVLNDTARHFAMRYLLKKNEYYSKIRPNRMAVFANDYIGMRIYIDGYYEKEEVDDLIKTIKSMGIDTKSKIAIDVGANIGNHTSMFCSHFNHVHSFEPSPHTFRILQFNASFEKNVTVHNFGLSNKNENLMLSEMTSNYGASSVLYIKNDSPNVEIQVRPLDEYYDIIEDIGLIKIDVEGMEHHVISGAQNIINRDKPVIVFEQHKDEFCEYNETKSIKLLRENGYEILHFIDEKRKNNFFLRRMVNLYELFFGRYIVKSIVWSKKIPPAHHSMLIAVHARDMEKFGIYN